MDEGARHIADGAGRVAALLAWYSDRILSRARKPSPLVARRMEELMEESERSITAVVPDEMETLLREWAAEAHESIEQLLDRLLAELPKGSGE